LRKIIYYHRHGETHFTAKRQGYGDHQYEALLTRKGHQEVSLLGAELARRDPFDLYLTSPLPRAVQSATIVHSYLKNEVELQIDPDLIEPIRESPHDTWKRITRLAERLLARKEQQILLSTHGYICVCLTAYFRGNTLSDIRSFDNPPTGSFGWIELLDGQPVRACRISDGHLAGLLNGQVRSNTTS
jgi:broad specificity phosphatase PhoE